MFFANPLTRDSIVFSFVLFKAHCNLFHKKFFESSSFLSSGNIFVNVII